MNSGPLPFELRPLVCEKLFETISGTLAPSVHSAAAINTIGCYLLCHLTDEDYEVTAGSLTVRMGGAPIALQADPARLDEDAYYVWIECRHTDGRVELVDFAAPWWADWARELHMLWLGPAPEAVWTFVDELDDSLARYTPHAEITNMVRTALHHAFRSPNPPEQVAMWESAINGTVDLLARDPRMLDFLIERGVAGPDVPGQH